MEIVSLNRMFPCRKKNYYCYMDQIQPMKHLMSFKNKRWGGGNFSATDEKGFCARKTSNESHHIPED
jgi:hypothetical protein